MADPFEVRQTWSGGRIKSYAFGIVGFAAIFLFPFVFMVMVPDGLDDDSAQFFSVIATGVIVAVIFGSILAIEKGDLGFARPVRLTILAGGFTIVPDDWGTARLNVTWDQLLSVSFHTDAATRICIHFKTTDGTYQLATHFLDKKAEGITRRMELLMEQSGKYLMEIKDTPVPTWEVVKGRPYDKGERRSLRSLSGSGTD